MAGRRLAVDGKQRLVLATSCVAGALIVGSTAQATDESRDDAWWTGPMTAASAAMLPQGHMLVEPYLYDVVTTGRFDTNGSWEPAPGEHDLGSLQAGYGLTRYHAGGWLPEISVVLDETLPTGRYDRLAHLSDGFGAGSYTTALAVYSQDYFWAPNGRIVRTRLDLTYSVSSTVSLRNQSVYGTAPGFQGEARPGDSFTADAAAEYSLTQNWVLALDVIYQHVASTRVTGSQPSTEGGTPAVSAFTADSGSSYLVGFAPAVEYNWNGTVGILVGVRIFEIGRNVTATVTPVIAINLAL